MESVVSWASHCGIVRIKSGLNLGFEVVDMEEPIPGERKDTYRSVYNDRDKMSWVGEYCVGKDDLRYRIRKSMGYLLFFDRRSHFAFGEDP